MNDVFIEYMIKRRVSLSGVFFRVLSSAVVAILALLMMLVFMTVGFTATYILFFVVLFGYVSYKVWQYTYVEYEYAYLNGELTIDRISGQYRRKRMEVLDIKNAEIIAPENSERLSGYNDKNFQSKDYSTRYKNHKKYVVIAPGRKGITKVIIEPNDAILEAMKTIKPRDFYLT